MLTLHDVVYQHPGQDGFRLGPINLQGPSDRPWIILGGPGSGKTTLLRLLTGDLQPQQGRLDGAASAGAYLPQFPERAFAGRNVAEELSGHARPPAALREALRGRLAAVGLSHVSLATRSDRLSAGERRRLALALLEDAPDTAWGLDEPDAGLDQEGIERLRARLRTRNGRHVWITTFRPSIYDSLDAFTVVLERGRVVNQGTNYMFRTLEIAGIPLGSRESVDRLARAVGQNKLRGNVAKTLTFFPAPVPQFLDLLEDRATED